MPAEKEQPLTASVIAKWIGLSISIATVLVSIVWFAASLQISITKMTATQEHMQAYLDDRRMINEKRFSALETRVNDLDSRVNDLRGDLRELKTQVGYVYEWAKEQRAREMNPKQ